LSLFPFIGTKRPHLGPGIRGLVSGNYVIFYLVEREDITVVRIIDGRMDIDEEFHR
jgi:toxin ParE1/3/4